jgi:hypothetical protein
MVDGIKEMVKKKGRRGGWKRQMNKKEPKENEMDDVQHVEAKGERSDNLGSVTPQYLSVAMVRKSPYPPLTHPSLDRQSNS